MSWLYHNQPYSCDASAWLPDEMSPPNQRLKLSGRGGRLKGNGLVLIAAAAPRSLSAIR
jgi:hypothetical protein